MAVSKTSPSIVIDAPNRTTIRVRLVGKDYDVYQPKGAAGLELMRAAKAIEGENLDTQLDLVGSLVGMLFNQRQAEQVTARLHKVDDPLDLQHIMELVNALSEEVTGNPTT